MTPHKKAGRILLRKTMKRQTPIPGRGQPFDPRELESAAFMRRHKAAAWQIAIDYRSILRFLANLAGSAACGVTAAEKALDDIAEQMPKIRAGHMQPGDKLFATNAEWKVFLENKLAEWAAGAAKSGARLLVAGLKSAVRAAALGEPEAAMALDGVLRKLQKLGTESSRPGTEEVVAPSTEELQRLFDLPTAPPAL